MNSGVSFRKPRKMRADINMINLIDVMFILNIFLLITTSFSMPSSAIDVSLPKTTQAKTQNSDPANLEVKVDRMERVYLNNSRVSPEKLKDTFAEKKMLSQNVKLVITADAMCSHGKIVEILDLAKKYGVTNLNISTENTVGEKYERQRAMAN